MLVKTQSLKNLIQYGDKSLAEIISDFSPGNTIFSVLSQDCFQRYSWSEIKRVKYATMNCMTSTKWSTLLDFIFGINGIQSEFVFIDAFCLRGSMKKEDKLLPALVKIFESSSEHHIMEPGSLLKGWTWHDFSLLSRIIRPTLHSSTIDIPLNEMLIDNIKASGFDFADFSVPEDRDKVRGSIMERWGSMENFNTRILDTVGTSLDLAQVCYLYIFCIHDM